MKIYDVIIIGAGMAGLSAGSELYKSNKNILLLEGRDRIGGRLSSERTEDNLLFERGGELIHGTKNQIYELANKLSLEIQEVKKPENKQTFRPLDTLKSLLMLISLRINTYPKPNVDENLQDYLKRIHKYLPESLKEFLDKESVDLETFDKLSALHIINRLRRQTLEGEVYGDHDFLIKDGYIQILEHLAQNLPIEYNHKVESIDWTNEIVRINTTAHEFQAKKVISTLPIPILRNMNFKPSLPTEKIKAINAHVSGDIIKFIVPVPVGSIKTSEEGGIIENASLVPSWWRRNFEGEEQIFVGWITGPYARTFLKKPESESVEIALNEMSELFETSKIDRSKIVVQNWMKDEYSQGTYCYIKPGYDLDIVEKLRSPLENKLFFAGTATSEEAGTAHGAFESGIRVASEILHYNG